MSSFDAYTVWKTLLSRGRLPTNSSLRIVNFHYKPVFVAGVRMIFLARAQAKRGQANRLAAQMIDLTGYSSGVGRRK